MDISCKQFSRRSLLALGAGALLGATEETAPVEVTIDTESEVFRIPDGFLGFGYEISSVAKKGLLAPGNRELVQLYRTLGGDGVVRIGGNTSDYSRWEADGKAVSAPKATVTNREVINDLGGFLHATGWKLIWGLNLGSETAESAVDQAVAVAAAAGDKLLCFEIGNEPDLFSREGHRPPGYNYARYQQEYSNLAAELRRRLPNAPLAGPDVAGATDWVASFAQDESESNLKLLTHHYYRAGQKQPAATFDNLLHADPRFAQVLGELRQDSDRFDIPYRLVELNSFSGGGKPGVSDTFASALWALDLLFLVASHHGEGVNLETGVNQLGFVSSYSPVFEDENSSLHARPCYYAMLAFAQASKGTLVSTSLTNVNHRNLTAYAVETAGGQLWVTLINKEIESPIAVALSFSRTFTSGQVMRLTAPAFDSKTGTRLAGGEVDPDGRWKPADSEDLDIRHGRAVVKVPAASAALILLRA